MCQHRPNTASHWRHAQRIALALDVDHGEADARVDELAARVRIELADGASAPRSAARVAIDSLRLLADSQCRATSSLLPPSAASTGRGHELACVLVLMEACRRAGADVRLAASDDTLVLLVGDDRGWGAVAPRWGALDWVALPVAAAIDQSFHACCAHDASRMLLALLAPVLPSEQLLDAMQLADELTAA